MVCEEALEKIEAVAAAELAPDARLAAHLKSCGVCGAALTAAREIERLLQSRPVPSSPPQFTSRTLARIRREWWRSDQVVDAVFNLTIAVVFLTAIVIAWIMIRSAGIDVGSVGNDIVALAQIAVAATARRIAPVAPAYGAATLLLAATLVVWWWVERDVPL